MIMRSNNQYMLLRWERCSGVSVSEPRWCSYECCAQYLWWLLFMVLAGNGMTGSPVVAHQMIFWATLASALRCAMCCVFEGELSYGEDCHVDRGLAVYKYIVCVHMMWWFKFQTQCTGDLRWIWISSGTHARNMSILGDDRSLAASIQQQTLISIFCVVLISNINLLNDHSYTCLRCSLRSDRQRLCDTVYHPGSDCNGSRCPLCSCFDATCFWVSLVWCDSAFCVFLDEPWSWHSMKPRWNNHPARNSSTGHMCNGWFTFSCLSFDDWTLNALVRLSPAVTIQENQTASASLGDTWATPGSGEFSDRLNMIRFIEECFFLIWVGCQPTTTSLRNPATSLDRRGRLSYPWFWKQCSLILLYISNLWPWARLHVMGLHP